MSTVVLKIPQNHQDFRELYSLGIQFNDIVENSEKEIDEIDTLIEKYKKFISQKTNHIIVAYLNKVPIGFAIASLGNSFFSASRVLAVQALYVKSEYQNTSAALKIMNYLKSVGEQLNAKEIRFAITVGEKQSKRGKIFLKKIGCISCGENFLLYLR